MAGWFATLMQKGHAPSRRAIAAGGAHDAHDAHDAHVAHVARDARHDAAVRMLREREADDRAAREKRQRGYRQSLPGESPDAGGTAGVWPRVRLHRLRTKVPCRATPEARALLDDLAKRFPGGTVTFPEVTGGRQAVMLAAGACAEPRQVGWIEQCVLTDPARCNVRHQGLSVETDGDAMLVLRFRYAATAVRVSSPGAHADATPHDVARVDFSEIRTALDPRPVDKGASPRLVWITRPEIETIEALGCRDYESFYVRFKLEVMAGIWSSLSALLASAPGSVWHRGSYFTVVREPDATSRRIHQRTVDDGGRRIDVGADRVYDAAPATDVLLLHLDGDILADVADIYFTLRSAAPAEAYSLKEEFFTVIRRFWAGAHSLASRYGGDVPTVVRMAQRALPMPAQAPMLRQDWINLRQALVDRYGEGGRKARHLSDGELHRPRVGPAAWPFASFAPGDVDVGLQLIHRQEWRHLGTRRGDVLRTVPAALRTERTTAGTVPAATTKCLDEVVRDAVAATMEATKWRRDAEGSVHTGVRALAARGDVESECRESCRDASARLADAMLRVASATRATTSPVASAASEDAGEAPSPPDRAGERNAATYTRLQHRYEVLTRPAELRNVVLVAEKLPAPADIDLPWVRRHDWILATALLDESFRDALAAIHQDAPASDDGGAGEAPWGAARERLYEHLRANILHYQRAVWQQEDPQQRSMRYRKSGRKVPLDWRFELESAGALTIGQLGDRLSASHVDGQFAAYSGGREAALEELIDPAGPIGYHGNLAIYHMRPEFGGADLFSMLHFFKSPYLRPHPEAGEPEVVDPLQVRIDHDPAIAASSDQAIAEHRDAMLEYLPELRLELARERRAAMDRWVADSPQREAAILRRHFAAYLFRRERARRIALDTDDVAVDAAADDAAAACARADGRVDPAALSAGGRLILESGRDLGVVSASGRRDADSGWELLRDVGARTPGLRAGASVARAHDASGARLTIAGGDADAAPVLRAGRPHDPAGERSIVARPEGEGIPDLRAGRAGDAAGEPPIRCDAAPARALHAGCVGDACVARALRLPAGAPATFTAGGGAAGADLRAIIAGGGGSRTAALVAGAAGPSGRERPIVARARGRLTLTVSAGIAPSADPARMSVAGVELRTGGDDRRARGLLAGHVHDADAARVILMHDRARVGTVGGTSPPHARARVILAAGDRWLRPSMIAG